MSMPTCCESFCDNGPRFLIVSMAVAVVQLLLGVTIAAFEIYPWNLWFAFFMISGAVANVSVLKTSWRNARKYGDLLGIIACLHYGHCWSAGLLESLDYTGGRYKLNSFLAPMGFLVCAILMTIITFWHKKVVCPRDPNDPSHIANQTHPKKFKVFKYTLGPMASFVYGMAESRFGSGLVPVPHSVESLMGICTSFLMFALYYRKYRVSAWGSAVSAVWTVVVIIIFILSCVLYAAKAAGRYERKQYGISMLVCLSYMLFFITAFTFKFCLLKEPINLNFSAPPIDTSKSSSTIVAPQNNGGDIEAQPFGMTRSEAEATARKLGFSGNEGYLERNNTGATETSMSERNIKI